MARSQLSASPPESPREQTDTQTDPGCDPEEVLEILGDTYTQKVLAALGDESLTGRELIERSDVSKATAYRRLDDLQEAGIVESDIHIDPNGHHCEEYAIVVDSLSISLGEEGFDVSMDPDGHHTGSQEMPSLLNADD